MSLSVVKDVGAVEAGVAIIGAGAWLTGRRFRSERLGWRSPTVGARWSWAQIVVHVAGCAVAAVGIIKLNAHIGQWTFLVFLASVGAVLATIIAIQERSQAAGTAPADPGGSTDGTASAAAPNADLPTE